MLMLIIQKKWKKLVSSIWTSVSSSLLNAVGSQERHLPCVSKYAARFSSITYSILNRTLSFLAHNILIFLASKYLHTFHLTLAALLQPNRHIVFLWVDGSEKIMDDAIHLITDKFQDSLRFQVLTRVSVAHASSWLYTMLPTNKITFSAVRDLPLPERLSTAPVSKLL